MEKSPLYLEITRLLAQGKFDAGCSLLNESASKLSPAEHLECQGNFEFYSKHQQEALDKYEEAMKTFPDYDCARYHYFVGVKAELAGNSVEAYDRYNASITIEPTFVDAYVELAGVLVKAKDHLLAARCLEDAAKLMPNDLMITTNLRAVYEYLAWENPSEFRARYRQVQSDYARLKKVAPPIPPGHEW